MIDNFAILLFTICIVITVFRATQRARAEKKLELMMVRERAAQKRANQSFGRKPGKTD